jgi:DNA-binding IclR family transcriptional regulator
MQIPAIAETTLRAEGGVGSVHVAFDIVEMFANTEDELGVTEVAQRLQMSKAAIFRHLATLVDRGYLTQNLRTARYRLAGRFYLLGRTAPVRFDLVSIAKDMMDELRNLLGQNIALSALSPRGIAVLATARGNNPIDIVVRPGTHMALDKSAQGRIALAFGPENLQRRLAIFQAGRTGGKIAEARRSLEREIAAIRRRGWAVSAPDAWPGIRALAVPMWNADGGLVGALAVVGQPHFVAGKNTARQVAALCRAVDRLRLSLP